MPSLGDRKEFIMGKGLIMRNGGLPNGVDISDATALPENVSKDIIFYGKNGRGVGSLITLYENFFYTGYEGTFNLYEYRMISLWFYTDYYTSVDEVFITFDAYDMGSYTYVTSYPYKPANVVENGETATVQGHTFILDGFTIKLEWTIEMIDTGSGSYHGYKATFRLANDASNSHITLKNLKLRYRVKNDDDMFKF